MRKTEEIKLQAEEIKLQAERAAEMLKAAEDHVAEIERLEVEAREEELTNVENLKTNILKICNEENMFCGIILTPDDIAAIVKAAIASKENISIPFNLYFKEL
jgi:hypothetical protein